MTAPGFTAEASLYKSRRSYRSLGGGPLVGPDRVLPAQLDVTGVPPVLVDLGLESNQAMGLYRCKYFSKLDQTCSLDCAARCRRYFMTGQGTAHLGFDPGAGYVDLQDCIEECNSWCKLISTVCYPRLKTGRHLH